MSELGESPRSYPSRISEITEANKDLSKSYSRLILKNDNPEEFPLFKQDRHKFIEHISRHQSVTKIQIQRINDVIRHASDLNAIIDQSRAGSYLATEFTLKKPSI